MRKIAAMITSIVVILFYTTNSFAQTITLSSRTNQKAGTLSEVKCSSQSIQDKIEISVDAYEGYIVKRYNKPDRIVIDIPNTTIVAKQQGTSIKSNLTKAVRYAQFSKTTARIVIDTVGQPQYQVEEKKQKLVLYIMNPIVKGVSYYNDGDKANIILAGIKLVDGRGNTGKLFTEKHEMSGKKYTVTFLSKLGKLEDKTVKVNDTLINSIQIYNNKKTKETSIIFNAKDRLRYEAAAKDEVKGTVIKITNSELADRAYENRGSEDEADNGGIEPGELDFEIPVSNPEKDDTDKQKEESTLSLLNIKHSFLDNGASEVAISLENYLNYNIMRLTGPDRLVIDIPNTNAPVNQETLSIGSSLVKSVRYAQFEDKTARIVLDTEGQPQFRVEERPGQLALVIEKPTYKSFKYNSSGDRVHFILSKVKLTEGGEKLKKLYTESTDDTGLKYTISFKSEQADIGYGTFKINDSLLNTVDIVKDDLTGMTSITFNAKDKTVYNTISRQLTNDTAITVLKPFTDEDKLIVIDAGHGGIEPGAVQGDLKEKTLNLDIAIRLNSLLKSKGVKTYMTREDDSYVGLYERAYIANKLNAKLFLSIHNNAYYSKHKGTEVLYHSSGGFGKKFAQILQDILIGKLNTYDRKIKARPELVVLKATLMPSALAEIAFMTNKDDKEKLMDENFRQKSAEALCEGIMKALESMDE
ncbi:MAG: N-acetylmuramoyl-L-alanine amidase [Clostridia bacterium]|nr:N-acetylmuramoyl-L-alanine amidase [Clostridia bacterium]